MIPDSLGQMGDLFIIRSPRFLVLDYSFTN